MGGARARARCASLALSPLPLIFSYKSEKSLCGTEPEPPPSWREIRQAEIESELDAKIKRSEQGIFARLFGCGRSGKRQRGGKNAVYALEQEEPNETPRSGLSDLGTMTMEPITEEEEELMLWPNSHSSEDQFGGSDSSVRYQSEEDTYSPGVYTEAEIEQLEVGALGVDRDGDGDGDRDGDRAIESLVPSFSVALGSGDAPAPRRYEAVRSGAIYQDASSHSNELDTLSQGEVIVAMATQEVAGIVWVRCSLGWVRTADETGAALLILLAPGGTPQTEADTGGQQQLSCLENRASERPSTLNRPLEDPLQSVSTRSEAEISRAAELYIEDLDIVHPEGAGATTALSTKRHIPRETEGDTQRETDTHTERETEDWSGLTRVLRNNPDAVVTAEGAVWWPQIRPPLTAKQRKALQKGETAHRKRVDAPEQEQAERAVADAVADLISEVEAALELSGEAHGATVRVAERRGDHDRTPVEAVVAQSSEPQLQLKQTAANPELATHEPAERAGEREREGEGEREREREGEGEGGKDP